ncbi:uncharacterized protein L203_101287 [Cryptococcus depauperatus CBS 7841]|uniref:Uncharacterized protein n=1 Tax=Cryptococcus depauperatus CBS 7841 TaxID=1295531 RepID=A0A1E3ICB2_9TREE|nr:hypothetical protein L203_04355 [Cryptococcus depauperatus CBS 7841]
MSKNESSSLEDKPDIARKISQPNIQASSPKFYNGPTVKMELPGIGAESASYVQMQKKNNQAVKKTSAAAKSATKNSIAKVKKHPWSFFSFICTIPFLIMLSLASTVLCPLPGPPSAFNKYILSPLGYPPHQSHPVLCYPANVYQQEVLQPYIYPIVDDVRTRVVTSSTYVNYIGPTSSQVKRFGRRAWNGPIKSVVVRINRGVKRFYLTYVQPHIPYYKAKFYSVTAPYTQRLSSFAAPYLAKVEALRTQVAKSSTDYYTFAAAHPYTGHATRYAKLGYKLSSKRSQKAYQWTRPHIVMAGSEAKRIVTQVFGPRAIIVTEWTVAQIKLSLEILKTHICAQYRNHLEPHIGSYVKKASIMLAPYYSIYHHHVHAPYVRPFYNSVFPPEEKSKTFLGMLADWLPSNGQTAAESRGGMDDFFQDAEKHRQRKQADKPAEKRTKATDYKERTKKTSEETKSIFNRKEMDKAIKDLSVRIDEQGRAGEKQVNEELETLHTHVLSQQLPEFATNMRSEIEREIEYILKGLDKLYTQSTQLKKDQVKASSDTADARVRKTVDKIQQRLELKKGKVYNEEKLIVKKAMDRLDSLIGQGYQELAKKISSIDDVSTKDWDKYHAIRKHANDWKDKYDTLHEEPSIFRHFSELRTELDDIHEGFRSRVGILKRTALDRIEAREAVKNMKKEERQNEPSRVSILPVAAGRGAAAAGVAGAGAVIGKGKEQVMSALSAASGGTPTGIAAQAKASADSILSMASSQVHEVTRSLVSAAGGTPSPESPQEHAQSVYAAAKTAAASILGAASSQLHEATRSAAKAVGMTPSPESPNEYIESVYAAAAKGLGDLAAAAEEVAQDVTAMRPLVQVKENAASILAAASSQAHEATRSVISVAGGTPSPESPKEYAESAYAAANSAAASVLEAVGSQVHDATRSVMKAAGTTPSPEGLGEKIESATVIANLAAQKAMSEVSKSVHDASRIVVSALGGTPSPESPDEYAESIYEAMTDSVVSLVSEYSQSASSLASDASATIHSATRTLQSAMGTTPTPESFGESLESMIGVVNQGADSVYGAAGDSLHDVTRKLVKAAGGTPSPENPQEYVESIYNAASRNIRDVKGVVSEEAIKVATQIQEILGVVSTPTPLASAASNYLSSLSSVGASNAAQAAATGSSLLSSLQKEASSSLHSATRSASSLLGATPTPETPSEYIDEMKARAVSAKEMAASLVRKHAEQIKRDMAKDGKKPGDYQHDHSKARVQGKVANHEHIKRNRHYEKGVKDEL